jgi:G:T/U-mismatch repair DNA glycosylase
LEAIFFNGGRAAKDGRKLLAAAEGIELYDLTSSSGLAGIPYEVKRAQWQLIAQHLK